MKIQCGVFSRRLNGLIGIQQKINANYANEANIANSMRKFARFALFAAFALKVFR